MEGDESNYQTTKRHKIPQRLQRTLPESSTNCLIMASPRIMTQRTTNRYSLLVVALFFTASLTILTSCVTLIEGTNIVVDGKPLILISFYCRLIGGCLSLFVVLFFDTSVSCFVEKVLSSVIPFFISSSFLPTSLSS